MFFKTNKHKQISCSRSHALFASDFGLIFSCGSNGQGELGHGDNLP